MLLHSTDIHQFEHVLKLSHDQIVNALSAFRVMDKTGDGSIDCNEFAQIVNMNVEDSMFQYLFNALDVDRSNSVNFKEFLITASHFAAEHTEEERSRYCFLIVDTDNNGVISFDELLTFLVDVQIRSRRPEGVVISRSKLTARIAAHLQTDLALPDNAMVSEDAFVTLVRRFP
eukprot:CAMPEP_0172163932 /NCGR_PEP_ID=MMETSP1050-20130122/7552_2 /TAXON_ID=233186 /ORGANISM="Cryptomonas curvata, Strain CCAP979/52" /LENGTH=172 /DNA_ID=CAMNT_0012834189 /DNA_START=385 /DNA_END=899 /DNA_ORIENTATION=-